MCNYLFKSRQSTNTILLLYVYNTQKNHNYNYSACYNNRPLLIFGTADKITVDAIEYWFAKK